MKAREAIYITADKRLGVTYGKDFWLKAFGNVPVGGEVYDFGPCMVNGTGPVVCASVRSRSHVDEVAEKAAVDVSPVIYVTDERKP